MADLMDLLQGQMGQMIARGAAQHLGGDTNQLQQAFGAAIPMLMGALKKNASNPETAQGLFRALQEKHDGSIFDSITDIFSGGSVNEEVLTDGEKILGHVFGQKKEVVSMALSKQTGVDSGTAMNVLKMAAPVVMGFLGKQMRQNRVEEPGMLESLLGNFLGQVPGGDKHQSFIEKLIDRDNDGSIMDDLWDFGSKFF